MRPRLQAPYSHRNTLVGKRPVDTYPHILQTEAQKGPDTL